MNSKPYEGLTPDAVLDALESIGLRGDGRLLALNSYENRVYQVSLEDDSYVVAKFYRPERWSDAQILEEHAFSPNWPSAKSPSSRRSRSAAARCTRSPDSASRSSRAAAAARRSSRTKRCWSGSAASSGASTPSARRGRSRCVRRSNVETFGTEPRDWLLASGMIPEDLKNTWVTTVDLALQGVEPASKG